VSSSTESDSVSSTTKFVVQSCHMQHIKTLTKAVVWRGCNVTALTYELLLRRSGMSSSLARASLTSRALISTNLYFVCLKGLFCIRVPQASTGRSSGSPPGPGPGLRSRRTAFGRERLFGALAMQMPGPLQLNCNDYAIHNRPRWFLPRVTCQQTGARPVRLAHNRYILLSML
jgi:hypothetical protein